jgi:hypothetical protein
MSQRNKKQFGFQGGPWMSIPGVGGVIDAGTTVPADGTPGWAPNALFFDIDATGISGIYRNVGTFASCDFNSLTGGIDLSTLTATAAELNTLHNQTLLTGAPAGITGGTGTIYKNSVQQVGGIYYTTILIDLTGLGSSTTDLDIIGQGAAAAAHIGQITAAQCGTILAGEMTCLEVPATGVTDIDVYWATEGTGKFDDAVTGLTETVLLTQGGAWSLEQKKAFADPVGIANGYIYLCNGAAGTVGTYTAGKFLIELYGV